MKLYVGMHTVSVIFARNCAWKSNYLLCHISGKKSHLSRDSNTFVENVEIVIFLRRLKLNNLE